MSEEELLRQAEAAQRASQWETAQQRYEEVLALAEKNQKPGLQARALYGLSGLAQTRRQYPQALSYAQRALSLYKEAGDRTGEVRALNDLGNLSRRLVSREEGLKFLRQGLALAREIADQREEANLLTNIGITYGEIGEYTQAREHFEQSLPLHRKIGNLRGEANACNNIGLIYRLTGQFLAARAQFEQALALRRTLNDPASQATALGNIAICERSRGEYVSALRYYRQALDLQEPLNNKPAEAVLHSGLGSVYMELDQPDKARVLYEGVLAQRRLSSDRRGEATALTNLGHVYTRLGLPAQAKAHFQKAITLYQELADQDGEAGSWSGMGQLYSSEKQYEQAEYAFNQARTLYQRIGNRAGEAAGCSHLAATAVFRKRYTEAVTLCQDALRRHQELRNHSGESSTWDTLGQAQLALRDTKQALRSFQNATRLIEEQLQGLSGLAEARSTLSGSRQALYQRAVAALHQAGRSEEAFQFLQKTKGLLLREQQGAASWESLPTLTRAERERYGLLQEQSAMLNQQMIAEGAANEPGSKQRFLTLAAQLKETEARRATLEDGIRARALLIRRGTPPLPRSSATLARLLPKKTALIEFSLAQKPLAFVLTPKGLTVHTLPTNLERLTEQVTALLRACQEERDTGPAVNALRQVLAAPLSMALKGIERLILCPDGALWEVPFCLLFSAQSVSLLPSAAFWQPDKPLTAPHILVYANPEPGPLTRFTLCPIITPDRPIETPNRPIKTPDRDIFSELQRGRPLSALPGVEREAAAISRLFPSAVIRQGNKAQEMQFLQEAELFSVLHLAGHAFVNNASPLLSCLVLAPSESAHSSTDGFLTAQEILQKDLKAELVVLSACSTGQGEQRPGEGIIGLSWAFLAAGARQLLMTQWSVSDEATATFMEFFYTRLKAGQTPAAALQEARARLQKQTRWKHPRYWAGFALISGTCTT